MMARTWKDSLRPMEEVERTDESLMASIRTGDHDAFRELYRRHARRVFGFARRAVGPTRADEVAHDVLFTVWRKADGFDPEKGTFRAWLAQVTRRKVANELRTAKRDRDVPGLDEASVEAEHADDSAWTEQRRRALAQAIAALPLHEREALSLAFLDELSHEEVARFLSVPLGTAKTRIRSALRRLRPALAVLGIVAVVVALLVARRERDRRSRDDRALEVLTASDVTTVHLVAGPGIAPEVHGAYRARHGVGLAIVSGSNLDPAETYVAWARFGTTWVRLGEGTPNAEHKLVVVGEDPRFAGAADEILVTRGTDTGSTPTGAVILRAP